MGVALGLAAPRAAGARGGAAGGAWLALIAAVAFAAGLAGGTLRVEAIDAGALSVEPGEPVRVEGFVTAVPRRADGEVRVRVATPAGRVMVEAPEPVPDLDPGTAVALAGVARAPAEFERGYLERLGIKRVLAAREIRTLPERRGGLAGALDEVRRRAQDALASGTPPAAAALLRGFVLGQDDRIDPRTVEEFKRSGLAHLLAVSGQNVVLLAILAVAVLGILGIGLRARLLALLALIAIYVLVTGAGPSIQRAGVMGAAGVVAALAGRPSSRWYALGLAACATLALDPRAAADIGWQLSFAAVLGILLVTAPLARLLAGGHPGAARRAFAEAAAMTIAATAATAPLMSLHFGTFSVVSLPANLVAVLAEAPVMWLGMLAAAAGQLGPVPVEPVSWLAGLLAAYIAQVAAWFAAPSWAQVELGVAGTAAVAGVYAVLGVGFAVALRAAGRRRGLGRRPGPRRHRGCRRLWVTLAAGACALVIGALALPAPEGAPERVSRGLQIRVLDVGQGDAILLDPAGGAPVLIDAGPPGGVAAARLSDLGVRSLAALVVTHPDLDHAGGAGEVLGSVAVGRLIAARTSRELLGAAAAAGVDVTRVAAGDRLRSGGLRLELLWPRRPATGGAGAEANAASLVLLARWRGFRMLLPGDAEAELAPVHPGEIDVLKVAHHGSADAGLEVLLAEADPELALISVGAGNPYGHPTPATVQTLAAAGVEVLRTDTAGEVVLAVGRRGWSVSAGTSR